MNILITGNLTSLAATFAKEFAKRKNRIVLSADGADKLGVKLNNTIAHSIDPAGDIFRDAMSSYGFDVVVFISTREEQLYEQDNFNTGHQLDGLRNTLELYKHENLKHFFYISSTEVYGNADDLSEQAMPQPLSPNGHILLTGEQLCRIYHDQFGVNTTIVRVTNSYGPDEKSGLFNRLIRACNNKSEADFPAPENSEISLLHALDIADFLIRAIDEDYTPESLIVNLSCSSPIKYSELAQALQKYYPEVVFNFLNDGEAYTKPVKVSAAKKIYYWI